MRIVSLLPSATEIAHALGLGDQVVGVTFECDFPVEARTGREIVVGGLDTHGLDPGQIDALVRSKIAAGDDLYVLDQGAFGRCAPDVVLTQDLCRVCALPAGEVDAAMAHLGCTADVVTLDPHTLHDVLATITTVAEQCGVADRGTAMVSALHARLDAITAAVADSAAVRRPRVLVIEWIEPPFLAGHWVPELVSAAGGEPVMARPGERSVASTWTEIAAHLADRRSGSTTDGTADNSASAADIIVIAPCGYDLDGAVEQTRTIIEHLPAGIPVWAIDANGYVVRPGPRLVDGVETFAAIIHGVGEVDPTIARRVDLH